jgi:hypothetical protein
MSADGVAAGGSISDLWSSDIFLEEATAWVRAEAARHGMVLTGERERRRRRPWSSAIRYGSDAGHR